MIVKRREENIFFIGISLYRLSAIHFMSPLRGLSCDVCLFTIMTSLREFCWDCKSLVKEVRIINPHQRIGLQFTCKNCVICYSFYVTPTGLWLFFLPFLQS